ncbi:hypothetical protein Tco_1116644 [Tanacetum coccineum]
MSSSSFSSYVTVTPGTTFTSSCSCVSGVPCTIYDDLESAEAQPLPASVSPTTLSPDYSADSEPVEGDPEEHPEEDLEEEEELSALADSSLAGLYIDLPSKGTDVCPTSNPLPSSIDALVDSWKRAIFAALSLRFEIGESSAAAAARQPESALARGTDYGFVTVLEEVNERVTDLAASHRHDSHEFYVRRPGLQGKQDTTYARQSWTQAMDYIRGLQAEIRVLQQQRRDDADRKPKKSNMSATVIEELINQRVADALADYETNQNSVNGNGSHDSGGGGGKTPKSPRD